MTATADASFLVSLYGVDVNTAAARAWMVQNAEPILLTSALRFETENALRLACFRKVITSAELSQALADIELDISLGILIPTRLDPDAHWSECRRISNQETVACGHRAYDITHVAAAVHLKADVFLTFDNRQKALASSLGLGTAP